MLPHGVEKYPLTYNMMLSVSNAVQTLHKPADHVIRVYTRQCSLKSMFIGDCLKI